MNKLKSYAVALCVLCCALSQSWAQEINLKASELFGPIQARQIGPAVMSGRVTDLAMHPTNNKVVLVGSAGGGVWLSANGGTSYQTIFDDHCQSIGAVAFDPHSPDKTFWVGTGEIWTRNSVSIGDGIYKTTDRGSNWKKMGLENSERISSIQIHPDDPNTVYVGVLGALWSDSEERGVYKTTDGGQSWEKIFYISPKTGCSDLVFDPENPDVMYASMWEFRRTAWSFSSGGDESGLFKSTDGGASWQKIHTGYPEGKLGRIAFTVAPSDPNILYSVVEAEDNDKSGLYRSDDGGASWQFKNSDFGLVLRPFYFSRITVDPKDPDILIKAGLYGSISRDGGNTFTQAGAMHADIHDAVFDHENSDRIFFANDGGVNISYDGGLTTSFVDNLPLSQYYHISVDNQEPFKIYGGLQDNGSWIGPSEDVNGIQAGDWLPVGYGDGFRVYPHPEQPEIVYSEMQGAEQVWRYNTKTKEVRNIQPSQPEGLPELRYNWNAAMNTSPNNADRIYLGSQYLFVSNDKGDNWTRISDDLTSNDPAKYDNDNTGGLTRDKSGAENHCTIFSIAESPSDEDVIWVGSDDGLVHVTRDGGESWSNVTANITDLPAHTWCYQIYPSRFAEGRAYAVFEGHTTGDFTPYVYATEDFGASWTSIATDEIGTFVRAIQEDVKNPDILYLGSEMGLYISANRGKTWNAFTNNFPKVAVHSLAMSETGTLVAGTHGRGVILIDDLKPLRQLTPEVASEDVYFMESPVQYFDEETTFGGYGGNTTEFRGANPNSDIKLYYYLKKRPIFGKYTMKIYDEDGVFMANLTPSKKKGLNRVTWGGERKMPKMAKAGAASFSFATPRVPAGTYTAVLSNGKKEWKHDFEIAYPKGSEHTAEDRVLQNTTSKELYDMTQDLAYLVQRIDTWMPWVEKNVGSHKQMPDVLTQMETLKKTLVVTSGDNYTNAEDPKLREKMAKLFSTVTGFYGRPSDEQIKEKNLYQSQIRKASTQLDQILQGSLAKAIKKMKVAEADLPQVVSLEDFLKS